MGQVPTAVRRRNDPGTGPFAWIACADVEPSPAVELQRAAATPEEIAAPWAALVVVAVTPISALP